MSEDAAGWVFLFSIALVCALVWYFVTKRRAGRVISAEIMRGDWDRGAMSRAAVAAEGDETLARKLYIRDRLKRQRKDESRALRSRAWQWFCVLWGLGILLGVAYKAYIGELFWWWDGGSISRETVIGLMWVVTLVLVPYFMWRFAARRGVGRARTAGEVWGATFAAFVLLCLFSASIADLLV